MFDLGWTELLLIGVVALIVIGPKDLPGMFRALGKFTARIRGMAREFQRAMEDAANESGVKDVTKDLRKMGNIANPRKAGMSALKDATKDLTNWSPDTAGDRKPAPKTELSPERAEAAQKIRDHSAKVATERRAAEAAAAAKPVEAGDPAPPKDDRPVTDPNAPKGRDDA